MTRRVSRVFERIKPQETARDKYLPAGDVINEDLLIRYVVEKRRQPCPPVNFYEKPCTVRRDPAVLILLVRSGHALCQHDVRKACHEGEELGVHTFAISTTENTVDDMQLMFGKHFVLLRNLQELPRILPRIYSRLTF